MKKLTTVLVMVMAIFTANSFAQSTEMSAEKIKGDKKTAHTYFDLSSLNGHNVQTQAFVFNGLRIGWLSRM